jgi:hypothetical protein
MGKFKGKLETIQQMLQNQDQEYEPLQLDNIKSLMKQKMESMVSLPPIDE